MPGPVVKGRKQQGPSYAWLGWLPFVLVGILLLLSAVLLIVRSSNTKHLSTARIKENQALGLPGDFPSNLVPIYPGITVVKAEKGSATSDKQEPMDKWYLHATSSDSQSQLHDYYVKWAEKRGMSQTMGVQIPTGYGVNYADEQMEVQFVMEQRPPDKLTHLEITVFKLQK